MVSPPKSRDICVPASKFHPMHRTITRSISWGHVPLDCQEFVMRTLSLIPWTMAYHQVRGRAASLSPKSRPKVHLPARSAPLLGEIRSPQRAQHAKRTGLSMTDASHRMDKPAPQSVALYLPPFSHTGSLPSARTPSSPQNSDPRQLSRRTFSFDNSLGSEAVVEGCKLGFQLCKVGFEGVKQDPRQF